MGVIIAIILFIAFWECFPLFRILISLFYILCWCHTIFRLKTGGKNPYGPGHYCCDPNVTFDEVSVIGTSIGTVILLIMIIVKTAAA